MEAEKEASEKEVEDTEDEEEEGGIRHIMKEKEEEIENLLESKAKKLNMNRTQVRTLLRQILGSKDVIDHSLEIAGDKKESMASSSSSSSKIEPRITRTIAKSVEEVGGKLDWVLETIKSSASQANQSVNDEDTLVLVTRELPDDDKPEDDPEYNPEADLEGDDDLDDLCNTPNSSVAQTPPCSSSMIPASPFSVEDAHRLTRSKTSLKEVSIEELEKKFIPPDITSDMYSSEMDEYSQFLQETFGYQEPVASGSPGIQEEDPDFIYQDIEESAGDSQYEFKFDRSTKIPRKEVDDLISELLAEYEDSKGKKPVKESSTTSSSSNEDKPEDGVSDVLIGYSEISDEHIARLSQQMRQHIQLLLQMALLTSNDPSWGILNRECKAMFKEILNRSLSKKFSLYAQDNLFPSMSFLQEWEDGGKLPSLPGIAKNKFRFSKELLESLGSCNCIIYPYLLPTSSLKTSNDKSYFSEGEDYLIVYGMDRYKGGNPKKEVLRLISTTLMTPKSPDQIRCKIKNSTSKSGVNIIKSYVKDGVIPRLLDPVIPYIASEVVQPRHCVSGELPEPWCIALNVEYDPHRASKHPMLVKDPIVPSRSPKVKPIAKQGEFRGRSEEAHLHVVVDPSPQVRPIVPKPLVVPQSLPPHPIMEPPLPHLHTEEEENSATASTTEDQSLQEAEAGDIFLCVHEMLPPDTRNLFFEKIVKLTSDKARAKPSEIFSELHGICEGYSDLQERLLDLLNPCDAMSLGPDIFFQFKVRNFAKRFLKKTSLLYKDDPPAMAAVVEGLQDIVRSSPSQLGVSDIRAKAVEMFKGDTSLINEFLSFLPNVILSDVALKSMETEVDVLTDKGPTEFERTSLPKLTDIDQGSERCVCNCHANEDSEQKKVHCVHCSLRFVNGQVYRKDGKMTRCLQVRYRIANGTMEVPRKKRKN